MASSSSDFDEALAYALRCVHWLMHCVVSNKKASFSMSIISHFRDIFLYNYGMFYDTVDYLCGHAHIQCILGMRLGYS